ncbi:hypothetical protein [Flavobacterium sp. '19STA2R22 D10 B1']|uniref:hypothetical protein n=1 Tax=Flavobacterium aerium TaxID=3037261 RepID=UPI00278C584C|nr:hypothetical protein [Flavobacterium sp. '19STA2R22 D10 B1']
MKKLIVLLFTVFTFATYAQGSYYEKVHYRSTPESSWEGIDVTLNIKITSSITSGGITYGFIVDNIKINSIKIRTKEISASQIPFNVLSKLKASISIGSIYCDLYNASFFLKKIDLPKTVGWAELLEVNNEEGYKQSVKNKVTVLYNSGAFNTQNLTLVTCNYFIDDNYRKTIEKEITDNGKTKTAVKTKTSNNEVKELGLVISSSSTSPESNPDESSSLNTAKETSTNEISVANNMFAAENARKYNEQKAIVDVATGILDLFSTSPEQERQWAAEREEKKRILQDKQDFFDETYFNPLIAKAKKGDENSRMILYFASNYHDIELKDGKKWLFEAAKKNNFNAMLEVANILIQKDSIKEAITIIEEAANL